MDCTGRLINEASKVSTSDLTREERWMKFRPRDAESGRLKAKETDCKWVVKGPVSFFGITTQRPE